MLFAFLGYSCVAKSTYYLLVLSVASFDLSEVIFAHTLRRSL
jgi:hypothetical protein